MILVIDDSDHERALIRRILEADGYEVREAADGDNGLALFQALQPQLVLCDLMMPSKDGFETVRDIQRLAPEARIVATSGVLFGTADHATMIARLGLAAVIEKPFRQEELLSVVRRALQPPP
jgi:CheY-like chemotaxis protein